MGGVMLRIHLFIPFGDDETYDGYDEATKTPLSLEAKAQEELKAVMAMVETGDPLLSDLLSSQAEKLVTIGKIVAG